MTVLDDILVTLTTYARTGRDRPSRVTCARAAEALTAYRSVALHYMTGDGVVDSRAMGGTMTWGVGGPVVTEAEIEALTDLWQEIDDA